MRAHGKFFCKKHRDPEKLLDDGYSVSLLRDYSNRLSCVYDGAPMSRDMGGGSDVGMEGILYFIRNKEGKIERHWMSFLSNAKQQDAKTTSYLNSCKLIDTLRENHGLLRRSG